MKKISLLILCCLFLQSLNAQRTLRSYKKILEGETNDTLITITVVTAKNISKKEKPVYKSIFDLAGRGQESTLSEKSNKEVAELLNKKFLLGKTIKKSVVDLTTKKIRITFSIDRNVSYTKENYSAKDRIEDLRYSFKVDSGLSSEVKFKSWDKYKTEYGTLDIGTLEFSKSFSANLDVVGKIGASTGSKNTSVKGDDTTETSTSIGPELSVAPKIGLTRAFKENQNVKRRYIQLTGIFDEREFKLHQQGARFTDLAGNVNLELTITLPKDPVLITSFKNLYSNLSLPNPPSKIGLDVTRYHIPDMSQLPNGVKGELNYKFAVRHIEKNARTDPEFDDKIKFITGRKTQSDVVLIKPDELKNPIYFITLNPVSGTNPSLSVDTGGAKMVINFLDFEKAKEFKNWLVSYIASVGTDLKIGPMNISFMGTELSNDSVKSNLTKIDIAVLE